MRHDEILGMLPNLVFGLDYRPGLHLFLYELAFWGLAFLLTLLLLRQRPTFLEKAEVSLTRISQRKGFWLVTFGLAVVAIRLALLPEIPVPVPTPHDEFSYLLAADTFAHGRVTNPASPMWVHFETYHVNVLPTYQSMYPPAQGLALAVGQTLTGAPWIGVVLSVAVMCGAIYWMLLGFLPPAWAWLGGAFAVVRYGIFSYWINSYFGGAMAAIGGALMLGAFPRFRRNPTASSAFIFSVGLLIMANSRPLEGFLFSLPFALAGLVQIIKAGRHDWFTIGKRLLPAMVLLLAGLAGMLYYNWRGTGHALLMPYALNFKTYHISNPFFFQKPNPIPEYRHASMRAFYVYHELPDALRLKFFGVGYFLGRNATVYYAFFLWPFLFLVAPALYRLCRDPEMRILLASLVLLALNLMSQIWPPHAHYGAPAAGAMVLLILCSIRYYRNTHGEHGLWASRAVVALMALWMISPIAKRLVNPYGVVSGNNLLDARQGVPLQLQRARIQSTLDALGGRHLVIVHHPPDDAPSQDWVYNDADIDDSHVIWAQDMGYVANKELIDHYPNRQVWYVDHGDPVARLLPYGDATEGWRLALERPSRSSAPSLAGLSPRPKPKGFMDTSYPAGSGHAP